MDYLPFDRVNQTRKFGSGSFKGEIKLHAIEEGIPIVSVTSRKAGFRCYLHLLPGLSGSIFDFYYNDQMITLILDYVIMKEGKLKRLNFLVEYTEVKK